MRKRLLTAAGLAGTALVLAGCGLTQQYDYEDAGFRDPDVATIYGNVDQHPNLVQLCIDGAGFATTTREYGDGVTRVTEWDDTCAAAARDTSERTSPQRGDNAPNDETDG